MESTHSKKSIRRARGMRGAAVVEYACMLLFVCMIAFPGIRTFGSELTTSIDSTSLALAGAFGGGTQSRTLVPDTDTPREPGE